MIRKVQNIYYMLAYAFQVLHEKGYRDVASEEFENGLELLAAILCRGVSTQIKRGLTRQYLTQEEALFIPRGKIEINDSIRSLTIREKQLVHACDEFSADAYPNRIIKTTLSVLLRANLSRPRKKELRRLLAFFDGVTPLDIHTISWNVPYDRNNQTYRMIFAVCQMLLRGMLQTEHAGAFRMMEYLDDQSMAKLYEKFILGYYQREHPALKAYAPQIKWAVTDGHDAQLPAMQTDIVLSSRETGKTLIIDAKYYVHNMQMKAPYMTRTVHSNNLYQLFAYAKNWPAAPDESVAGMLLYAGTDDEVQPDNDYQISGNTITVKTLGGYPGRRNRLDCPKYGRQRPGDPLTGTGLPPNTDLLIVMLGSNDLLQGHSPEEAAGKLERFCSGLSLPRDQILLIAPPLMRRGEWVPSQQLIDDSRTFAQCCRSLAERLGVRFADAGDWDIPMAYGGGHIPNAVLLPVGTIDEDAAAVIPEKDSTVLVYCRSGNRSKTASSALAELGYTNIYEFGGIKTWLYDTES